MKRAIWTVFAKEAVENVRDRRTLFSALLFGPLFGPILFAFMTSLTLERAMSDSDKPLPLLVAGAEIAPNMVSFLEENGAQLQRVKLSLEAARRKVDRGQEEVVLVIPAEYPERLAAGQPAAVDLVWDSSKSQLGARVHRVAGLISAYGRQLAAQRLLVRGVDPNIIMPIAVREVDVATPAGRAIVVLGLTTYFILLATLLGGLYLAIDTTAGERERGSLESLFTLPVARWQLVLGKVLATCAFMTLSLVLTLLAFAISLPFVPLEALGMTANFNLSVAWMILVIMLPFIPFGAGLMTLVGALTKSYREAQTWLGFVLLVPTLPIVLATLNSLRATLLVMPVPSLSQHLLATSVLRGESVGGLELAVSAASTLVLAAVLIAVAIRLYTREAVLG